MGMPDLLLEKILHYAIGKVSEERNLEGAISSDFATYRTEALSPALPKSAMGTVPLAK